MTMTLHDGFTLTDLVSYDEKHNQDNKGDEDSGSDENLSWNCGVEGESSNPGSVSLRERQKRNLISTLLFSQGVPMILAGDELGHTQRGNNNAYCQDNALSWIDWSKLETNRAFLEFLRRLIKLRSDHGVFRRTRFFHGQPIDGGGVKDIHWLREDGREMTGEDWQPSQRRTLGIRYASPETDALSNADPDAHRTFLLLLNGGQEDVPFRLPSSWPNAVWQVLLDTAEDGATARHQPETIFTLKAHSLVLFSGQS